jgi:hypothetical protein
MMFRRQICLPCHLLFGAVHDKEQPINNVVDLMEQLHDTHEYAHQCLEVATDKMRTHYNCLANSTGFLPGGRPSVVVLPDRDQREVA